MHWTYVTAIALGFAAAGCQHASATAPAHAPAAAAAQTPASTGPSSEIRRVLLAHEDVPDLPGYESRIYLIEFPPGAVSQPHVHSTRAVGYVLEGRYESSYDDGAISVVKAGEAFVDLPEGTHHFRNPDAEHVLRFIVSGTYKKDQPLTRPAS